MKAFEINMESRRVKLQVKHEMYRHTFLSALSICENIFLLIENVINTCRVCQG